MNAIIFIRLFIIFIKDKIIKEQVRGVMSSEIVFYQDYNLLIYFKATMITSKILKTFVKEIENSFESENSNFDNDLLNIKKIVREQNF